MAKKADGTEITTAADMGIDVADLQIPAVELTEAPVVKEELGEVEAAEFATEEDLVKVKTKEDLSVYFGNRYWYMKGGEVTVVTHALKNYLHTHGALDIM